MFGGRRSPEVVAGTVMKLVPCFAGIRTSASSSYTSTTSATDSILEPISVVITRKGRGGRAPRGVWVPHIDGDGHKGKLSSNRVRAGKCRDARMVKIKSKRKRLSPLRSVPTEEDAEILMKNYGLENHCKERSSGADQWQNGAPCVRNVWHGATSVRSARHPSPDVEFIGAAMNAKLFSYRRTREKRGFGSIIGGE